ncbi:MAG: hypothetical protein GVY13_16925 [Alphaproteobacteria bacterium]|jgi:outer membrane biosynthesis protein TonB|nr:hypothetical protein [Alphaproteobacteria bacterium]
MNGSQSIQVLEDSSVPGGGYAIIRVAGVRTQPADLSFYIRRIGYDQANLGYSGWQGPEERLEAFDSAFQPGTLDLMIGPELVDAIDVGTAIEIELPGLGLQQTLYWPDITPSVMGGAGAGRRVAFTGRQAAPSPRGQTPPPQPAAPPQAEPDADATMVGGRPMPPPPPPPPEDEPTVILGEDEVSGFGERDDRFDFGADDEEEPPGAADRAGRDKGRKPQLPLNPALLIAGIVALVLVLGGLVYFVLGESLGLRDVQVAEEDEPPAPDLPAVEEASVPPPEQPQRPDTGSEPAVTPPPPPPDIPTEDTRRPAEPPTEVAMQRQPRQPQTPPTTFVRSIVRGDPAPSELYELAQYHLQQSDVDVALLLLEQAEIQGYGPAMTAIGRMYDPVHFAPSRSAFTHANPERAIQYYRDAQQAGDSAADEALAELRDWLEVRAADGDPTAEELLRDYWQS